MDAKSRKCLNIDCNLSKRATQCIGVKVYLVPSILDHVLQQHPESVSNRRGRAANFNKDDWKSLLKWLDGLTVHCFGNGIKSGAAHTVQGLAFHDECLGWGLGSQCNDHVQHINIGKAKGYVQLRSLDHIACRLCPWCHMACRGTLTNTQRVVSDKDKVQLQDKRAIRNENASTARLMKKGADHGKFLMLNMSDHRATFPKDVVALASNVQDDQGDVLAALSQLQQQAASVFALFAQLQEKTCKDGTQLQRLNAVTTTVDLASMEQQVLADLAQDRAADVFMRLKGELTSALTQGIVSQDLRGAPNICEWQFPNFAEPQVPSNIWQQMMLGETRQGGAATVGEMQTRDGQPSPSSAAVRRMPITPVAGNSTGSTRQGTAAGLLSASNTLPLAAARPALQGTAGLTPQGAAAPSSNLQHSLPSASIGPHPNMLMWDEALGKAVPMPNYMPFAAAAPSSNLQQSLPSASIGPHPNMLMWDEALGKAVPMPNYMPFAAAAPSSNLQQSLPSASIGPHPNMLMWDEALGKAVPMPNYMPFAAAAPSSNLQHSLPSTSIGPQPSMLMWDKALGKAVPMPNYMPFAAAAPSSNLQHSLPSTSIGPQPSMLMWDKALGKAVPMPNYMPFAAAAPSSNLQHSLPSISTSGMARAPVNPRRRRRREPEYYKWLTAHYGKGRSNAALPPAAPVTAASTVQQDPSSLHSPASPGLGHDEAHPAHVGQLPSSQRPTSVRTKRQCTATAHEAWTAATPVLPPDLHE